MCLEAAWQQACGSVLLQAWALHVPGKMPWVRVLSRSCSLERLPRPLSTGSHQRKTCDCIERCCQILS